MKTNFVQHAVNVAYDQAVATYGKKQVIGAFVYGSQNCGWAVYLTNSLDKFSHFKGCKQSYKGIRKNIWSIEVLLEDSKLSEKK